MKKASEKRVFRIVASIIAALLASGQCALALPAQTEEVYRFAQQEHGQVRFQDMQVREPDQEAFRLLADKIKELAQTAENEDAMVKEFSRLQEAMDQAVGMSSLAMVLADLDISDEKRQETYVHLQSLELELSEILSDAARTVLDSPCGEYAQEAWGQAFCQAVKETEPLSGRQKELLRREMDLISEYNLKSEESFYIEWNGKKLTEADLDRYYDQGEITGERWNALFLELCKEKNQALGPIYLELLKVRTEFAQTLGEENYLDYAYAGYMRNYGTEDAGLLFENAQRILIPLEEKLFELSDTYALEEYAETYLKPEEIAERAEPYLERIGPELVEAFRYMRDYGLYDVEYSETKASGAYTISLPADRSAFLFLQPEGGFYDFSTFIHEFGHYTQTYWTEPYPSWPPLSNVDIWEIHSQGLELLFLDYYDEILGEYASQGREEVIGNILSGVTWACLVDQIEQYAYDHPQASLEQLNQAVAEISARYGYAEPWDPYYWVEISHIYESPGYFIGYATSAIAAFQIWEESLEDREKGIEAYFAFLDLLDVDVETALERCGLGSLFAEETLIGVRAAIEKELKIFRDSYGHWTESCLDTLAFLDVAAGEADEDGYFWFSPERPVTRAEFVSLLYRAADRSGETQKRTSFCDVKEDDWYADCAYWAIEEGIVRKTEAGGFGPHDSVSREEMAVMAHRFAQVYEVQTSGQRRMGYFTDGQDVSESAASAVRDLWERGLLSGYPDRSFRPKEPALRGEAAAVVANLLR